MTKCDNGEAKKADSWESWVFFTPGGSQIVVETRGPVLTITTPDGGIPEDTMELLTGGTVHERNLNHIEELVKRFLQSRTIFQNDPY
jgi:hypothetical protein